MNDTNDRKSNRLINEKSPYLLQHAYNPVDWYPWGDEAFARAKAEDKPVFLSIGYSSCHWCHVMGRESFADPEVASILNEHFISIKVDREERPDLDQIYMTACQALTGQGGWPLTVFLTPDKKPFFAGTYFPRESRHGLPGMIEILPRLSYLYRQNRKKVDQAGADLLEYIREQGTVSGTAGTLPGLELLDKAYKRLSDSFDQRHGGFGGAPKFPVPHQLLFLLRHALRSGEDKPVEMVTATLNALMRGGIYDQLGFGFHRYATDENWLVPHFEKMLYDQALLSIAYLEAYQLTGKEEFAAIARQVFQYVMRELLAPENGFYSAEDADTEGEEGLFYVWQRHEIIDILGAGNGPLVADYFGATEKGNFKRGYSVLHRPQEKEEFARHRGLELSRLERILEGSRVLLLEVRNRRERPFKDDKIITSWNGMMIAALARGAAILGEPEYAEAAGRAASFIKSYMMDGEMLVRRYRDGQAEINGFLDDYACFIWGLIELYQATFQLEYLQQAVMLNETMLDLFLTAGGVLQYSSGRDEGLPSIQDAYDGAVPAGNSMAALNLVRLGRVTGRIEWEKQGEKILAVFKEHINSAPAGLTFMLLALDFVLGPVEELVIAGKGNAAVDRLADLVRREFKPRTVLIYHPEDNGKSLSEELSPFIKSMVSRDDRVTAYLCRDRRCLPPANNEKELSALLYSARKGGI